jgi:hypothetical protein
MLYAFGFKRLGIVAADLYFLDPSPGPGQEGPERGVRLELRFLEQPEREGSIYASRAIEVGRPVWRVDLLESVDNPGSLDRAHHHPKMSGWEPGSRQFEPELSADPIAWVAKRLENVEELLHASGVEDTEIDAQDVEQLRASSGEILEAIRRLLERISDGELGRPPELAHDATLIRSGWL